MDLLVNIMIAVLALASGIVAVFGETVNEQYSSHAFAQLTRRGWFAIGCLGLTFSFVVAKEAISQQASIAAENRIRDLTARVKSLQSKNDRLFKLNTELQDIVTALEFEVDSPNDIITFSGLSNGETLIVYESGCIFNLTLHLDLESKEYGTIEYNKDPKHKQKIEIRGSSFHGWPYGTMRLVAEVDRRSLDYRGGKCTLRVRTEN